MTEPTTQSDQRPRLRLGGPADFIDVVPYLLGFHPRDSLVLVALREPRSQVGLTLRIDLPTAQDSSEAVATCLDYLERAQADAVLLVVYSEERQYEDLPFTDLVALLRRAVVARGKAVRDALFVGRGRWWSYVCNNPRCCPVTGNPIDDQRSSSVRAALAMAGRTAAPDRETLARSLEPEPGPDRAALAERCRGLAADRAAAGGTVCTWEQCEADWVAAIAMQAGDDVTLPDEVAARLLTALETLTVRDECARWGESADAEPAIAVLRQLARRAVAPWAVAPYSLLAWYWWRGGEGPLARMAVERALVSDPEYRFAHLLLALLDAGCDPRTWQWPDRTVPVGGR